MNDRQLYHDSRDWSRGRTEFELMDMARNQSNVADMHDVTIPFEDLARQRILQEQEARTQKRKELLDIKNKQNQATPKPTLKVEKKKDPLNFNLFFLNFGPYFFLFWLCIFNTIQPDVTTTLEATFAFQFFWRSKTEATQAAIRRRKKEFLVGMILCAAFFIVKMLVGYLVNVNAEDEPLMELWGIYYFSKKDGTYQFEPFKSVVFDIATIGILMVVNFIHSRFQRDMAKAERLFEAKKELGLRPFKFMHPSVLKIKNVFLVLGLGLCLYSLSLYVSFYTAAIFGLCQIQILLWGFKVEKQKKIRTLRILMFSQIFHNYLFAIFCNTYISSLLKDQYKLLRILGVYLEQENAQAFIATYYSYRTFMLVSTTFLCFYFSMWEKHQIVKQEQRAQIELEEKMKKFELRRQDLKRHTYKVSHSMTSSVAGDGIIRRQTGKEVKKEEHEHITSLKQLKKLFIPSALLWLSRVSFFLFIFHCFTNISPIVLFWVLYSMLSKNYTSIANSTKYFVPTFMIIQLIYYIQNIRFLIPESALSGDHDDWKHWIFIYDIPILDLILMLLETIPICLILYHREWIGETMDDKKLRNAIFRYLNQKDCPYYLRYFYSMIQYWEVFTIFAIYILGVIHNDLYHISLMFVFVFFALYPESFRKNFIRLLFYVSFFVTMRYLYQINADYLNYCPGQENCLFPEIMQDIGIGVLNTGKQYENLSSYQQWILLILLFWQQDIYNFLSDKELVKKTNRFQQRIYNINNQREQKCRRMTVFLMNAYVVPFAIFFFTLIIMLAHVDVVTSGFLFFELLLIYWYFKCELTNQDSTYKLYLTNKFFVTYCSIVIIIQTTYQFMILAKLQRFFKEFFDILDKYGSLLGLYAKSDSINFLFLFFGVQVLFFIFSIFIDRRCYAILERKKTKAIYERNFDSDDAAEEIGTIYIKLMYLKFLKKMKPAFRIFVHNFDVIQIGISISLILEFQLCLSILIVIVLQMAKILVISQRINRGLVIIEKDPGSGAKLPKVKVSTAQELYKSNQEFTQGVIIKTRQQFWSFTFFIVAGFFLALYLSQLVYILYEKVKREDAKIKNPTEQQKKDMEEQLDLAISFMFYLFWMGSFVQNQNKVAHIESSGKLFVASIGYLTLLICLMIEAKTINWLLNYKKIDEAIDELELRKKKLTEKIQEEQEIRQRMIQEGQSSLSSWAKMGKEGEIDEEEYLSQQEVRLKDFIRKTTKKPDHFLERTQTQSRMQLEKESINEDKPLLGEDIEEEEEKQSSSNFKSLGRRSTRKDLKSRLVQALQLKVLQIQWKMELKEAITYKYKSYFKCCLGTFLQDATIGCLLVASVLKASFVSYFYMIFGLFYLYKRERIFEISGFLVVILVIFQLFLALINLSSFISPMKLPGIFYYPDPCPDFYPGLVCSKKTIEGVIEQSCDYCSPEQAKHLHVFPVFLYSQFIAKVENLRWVLFLQLGVSKTKLNSVGLDLLGFAFYCFYYVNSYKQDQRRSITLRDDKLLQHDSFLRTTSMVSLPEEEKQEILQKSLNPNQQDRKEDWNILNLKLYSIKDKSWLTQTYKGCKVTLYLLFPIFCTVAILMLGILTQSLIPLTYIVAGLFAIASSVNFFKEDPLSQKAHDAYFRKKYETSMKKDTESIKKRPQKREDDELSMPLLQKKKPDDETKSNFMDLFFSQFEERDKLNEYEKKYGKYQYKWYYRGIYRYFIIPLISFDLTLQIIYFIPLCAFHPNLAGCPDYGKVDKDHRTSWQEILGFQDTFSWDITEQGEIKVEVNQHIAFMMIRCIIFFFCILSLRIFDSDDFKKFCSKYVNMILKMSVKKSLQHAYHRNNKKIIKIVRIAKDKNVMDQKIQNLRAWLETWRYIYKRFNRDPYNKKTRKLLFDDLDQDQKTLEKEENPAEFEINALFNDRIKDHKSITLTYTPDLSPEERELLVRRLVHRKSKTLPCCARFYDFIHRHWLNPMIFLIRKQLIEERLKESYQCQVNKHSEIDDRLYKDISRYFETFTLQKDKEKAIFLNKKEEKKYIEQNGRNSKVQIVHYQAIPAKKTEKWTSFGASCGRYSTFLPKLLGSHSDHVAYFFMILSMMINAGMISLPYPFLVFGYALMKENGPSKKFWNSVMWYTCFVIIFKVIAQQNLWITFVGGWDKFLKITETCKLIRLGVYYLDDEDLNVRSGYFVPELLVLFAIFAHQAKEISIGLWKKKQGEIENIHQAADRVLNKRFSTFVFTDSLTDPDIPVRQRSNSINVLYEDQSEEQLELMNIARGQERIEKCDVFSMPEKGTLNEYYKVIQERTKNRKKKKKSFLVDNSFMRELFPKLREEKPGKDFYNMMAISQFLVLIYIVLFFSKMEGQSTDFQEAISYSQFPGEMIVYLIFFIAVMTIDRFLFKGKSFRITKLVGHYEIEDVYVQENGEKKVTKVDFGETEITFKVVAKFYLQLFVILTVHILVFWIFPMYGDQIRTGHLYCKIEETQPSKAPSVCNDFKYSPATIIFYMLNLLYFLFSAQQIKYGLTEYTGRGFLMKSYNRYLKWSLNWYFALPFLFELRTSIDWMHSKTTLSVFGWLRVAYTKKKVFDAKVNRQNRANSPYGKLVKLPDKIFQGGCIFFIIMLSIVGPLLFFSTFNPIAVVNNPFSSQINANLIVIKPSTTANRYNLFQTDGSALVTPITSDYTSQAGFNSVIETSLYTEEQRIYIQMSPFSDQQWQISDPKKKELRESMRQVVSEEKGVRLYLEMEVAFTRNLPESNKISTAYFKKELDQYAVKGNDTLPFQQAKNISQAINYDCSQLEDKDHNIETKLDLFFNPVLRLGSAANATVIGGDLRVSENITLTYNCNNYWELDGELYIRSPESFDMRDQEHDDDLDDLMMFQANPKRKKGLQFFTFNDKVQSSYFPYTIVTFYTGVVLLIGSFLRGMLVHEPTKYPISQMPHPQKIIMLCETIMIYQMQGRFIDEEEAYAMLIEILRSTELLREISGRSIKDRPDGNKFTPILERGEEKEKEE